MNHTSRPQPPLQPRALCAAYAPLLPLLGTGGLAPDEAGELRAHLAECDWCQAKLAEYDTLYAALRRQFGADAVAVKLPSVHAIASRGRVAPISAPVRSVAPRRVFLRHLPRVPLRAEVAAALLVIVLLGALLGWQRHLLPGGPPPLDPQARAYLAVLHADYQPVLDALGVNDRQCINAFGAAPQADKPGDMLACRPVEQAVVTTSQHLLNDLATTPPPARWRTADGQLKSWARALIKAFTDRIHAIDAGDITRFVALSDSEVYPAIVLSCGPIEQINASLPPDRQLPATASGSCSS